MIQGKIQEGKNEMVVIGYRVTLDKKKTKQMLDRKLR